MNTDDQANAWRDPEFWLFRVLPLRATVPVAVLAAAIAWVVLATTHSLPGAGGTAAATLLIGLLPIRGRGLAIRIAGWVARRHARRDETIDRAPAFDVPLPEGGACGVRWDGDLLLTMLRIEPPDDTLTLLRAGTLSADQLLPLTEIAACLSQFDIELASIDVIATGARTAGTGPAARLYDSILGPLPAIAYRTCWLALRFDPTHNVGAVAKRGGGATGALRTAIIATRRVANRLATNDVHAAVLTATEMNSAVRELTHGFEPTELTETAIGLVGRGRYLTHYQLAAPMLSDAGFAAIWSTPTLSTTVTLRLRPGGGDNRASTVVLNAVVRFDTDSELASAPLIGLRDLPGRQRRMLLDTLPIGSTNAAADGYRGSVAALAALAVPTIGCGQLIGADERGQGIAVPLIGDGTRRVDIVGSLDLAQQVILRATGLGAHAVIYTARPNAWQSMVANLATPQLLSIAPRVAGASPQPQTGPPPIPAAPFPTTTVLVYDGIAPTSHLGGATVVEVMTSPRDPDAASAIDVTLIQDPTAPNRVTVRTATGSTTVTMVTTPGELHYIGESLAAR
ncbi:type VII secretion protein EccE [Nocardia camponoti]|uniref:Type VII secretion system protein EccE domain-containing protein n=1 Tax=Nocardia camponoti TaxID=1616106 RepID=A0A917QLP0_9NOCA|nr:type VII secretion protein EccE [Nocardia camponoti]GGK57474.1 hypothetical protein GCM10011591_32030 [Nocardia camponoti]